MKKLVLALAVAFGASMVACNSSEKEANTNTEGTETTEVTEVTETEEVTPAAEGDSVNKENPDSANTVAGDSVKA